MLAQTTVLSRLKNAFAILPSLPARSLSGVPAALKKSGDVFEKRSAKAADWQPLAGGTKPLVVPLDLSGCAIGVASSFEDAKALNLCSAKTTSSERALGFAERARKAASLAAGAISGCATIPGRPIPGDEQEFYSAKEAAALECMAVDAAVTAAGLSAIAGGTGATMMTGGVGVVAGAPAIAVGAIATGVGATMASRHGAYAQEARAQKPLEARRLEPNASSYSKDVPSRDTVNSSGWYRSEREARAMVRQKLGSAPVELEKGKLRSRDGVWQYRAKDGDVAQRHIHLERLDPVTGDVLSNLHLRW